MLGGGGVEQAWGACLSHDPASEEAACALMRLYAAQTRSAHVEATYSACRLALDNWAYGFASPRGSARRQQSFDYVALRRRRLLGPSRFDRDREQRVVTCLFVELSGPLAAGSSLAPEDLSERVGSAVGRSGRPRRGLRWHRHRGFRGGPGGPVRGTGRDEDDPERALLAAYLALGSVTAHDGGLSLRAGVETGHVVVGRLLDGGPHYGAFGEVMATAAVLQSVARPFSVLVGPATRAATGHLFEWGHTEEVSRSAGANRFIAGYLEAPKHGPCTKPVVVVAAGGCLSWDGTRSLTGSARL